MTGKDILDTCVLLIARTDVNRTLLLQFVNEARRTILIDKEIKRFYTKLSNVSHTDGLIDGSAINLKHAKIVEYQTTDAGETKLATLVKIPSYKEAIGDGYRYYDFTKIGTPANYLEIGTDIQILPVPDTGTINIYGEFWPADLTDSALSSDITTTEIPFALVYFGTAMYLMDFLEEAERGQTCLIKGQGIIDKYIKMQKRETSYKGNLTYRDPFGNLG